MEAHEVPMRDGERLVLYRDLASGLWACPVCGNIGLSCPPYDDTGFGTFDTCPLCNFEFGFDCDPMASGGPKSSVAERFAVHRERVVLAPARLYPEERMPVVAARLRAIGIEVPWPAN